MHPSFHPYPSLPSTVSTTHAARSPFRIQNSEFKIPRAFSLIELLVVIGIIALLASITGPAIKSLTKNNDQSQAVNLIRSMVSSARSIAISQHRQAGVVFFEETAQNSSPYNKSQTAMQIFVEDYNQAQYGPPLQGITIFITSASASRQYLPAGIMVATLNDDPSQLATGDNGNSSSARARAILFDANGNMLTRNGLARPNLAGAAGTYPRAYGDWNFGTAGSANAASSPGFYIFNRNDYLDQNFGTNGASGGLADQARSNWLRHNSTAILINANTGLIIR